MSELVDHQHAFMTDLALLVLRAKTTGYLVTGGELWRTAEQEAIYVKEGLSRTTQSNHLRRLAVDLNFFRADHVQVEAPDLGSFWEGLSPLNRWGGHFTQLKDPGHFERNAP